MPNREYQQCNKCVMDTSDPDIIFDESGTCNHCTSYFRNVNKVIPTGANRKAQLGKLFTDIKNAGKGRKYDCLLGISGGTDSSYLAHLAKEWKLRTLLTHTDNGYNSKVSERNIKRIVAETGFDFELIDAATPEFFDVQKAYLRASVVDIEAITNHALAANLYKVAIKRDIKRILGGSNFVTESIMPLSWSWMKLDSRNIRAIHKRYGMIKLKEFPLMGEIKKRVWYGRIHGIKMVYPLDLVNYNPTEAQEILANEFEWEFSGGKHYESIFTKFYQAYILPTKFGIDKRLGHYSTLVCSGLMTRKEALKKLEKPLYNPEELARDQQFVLNMMGMSKHEFENCVRLLPRRHDEFPSGTRLRKTKHFLKKILRR